MVADICDRVVVMQKGSIVESGTVHDVFGSPAEAYTRELISASLDDAAPRAELDAEYASRVDSSARAAVPTARVDAAVGAEKEVLA